MKSIIIILAVTLFCCKDRKHTQPASTTRDTGYSLNANPRPSGAGSNKLVNLTDSLKGYIGDRDTFFISELKIKRGRAWKRIKLNGDWTLEGGNSYGAFTRGDNKLIIYDSIPKPVYSNKSKIVDSGNVVLNPDTVTKWFRRRFDTAGATYEFFEITISETMKGKYKVLCYLKPDSAWVIKDSIALLKWFLNDLVQKYSPMHKFPVTKDSLSYPYNVR